MIFGGEKQIQRSYETIHLTGAYHKIVIYIVLMISSTPLTFHPSSLIIKTIIYLLSLHPYIATDVNYNKLDKTN
ncbi:MAG: hypothetical protein ACI9IL_000392 [Rickettsiales bacterium]|jgi:hypothetical protein